MGLRERGEEMAHDLRVLGGGDRLLFESRGWGFDDGDRKTGGGVRVSGGETDREKENCETVVSFVSTPYSGLFAVASEFLE
jgi:hypothetical protein